VIARNTLFEMPGNLRLPPVPLRVSFDAESRASVDDIK